MKKPRIYLDTSVISHLEAPDVPEKEADTRRLWSAIQAGRYEAFISPVFIEELDRCPEPKYTALSKQLRLIHYTALPESDEVLDLANQYVAAGVLREKSIDDCLHIAYACVYGCDMIVSWNFKHLVNVKTISGVKSVNALAGYREMPIYSPTMLVEGGAEDDS